MRLFCLTLIIKTMFYEDKNFFYIATRGLGSILVVFVLLSSFMFALLNGGAFWQNLRYNMFLMTPFASAELREGDILEIEERLLTSTTNVVNVPDTSTTVRDTTLVIPKIGVESPIVTPRNNSKSAILASLEEGVGLYPGSVNPGVAGRSIILGHSSLASWYRGGYATIFSLLPNLKSGDEIIIFVDGERLTYEVYDSQVMSPQAVNSFVNQPVQGHEIVLVTCYPIGSASQRNVVSARLVN